MSYANPIDTRIVQVVLDDLEDNNNHTLCELLANAYQLPWSVPAGISDLALLAAKEVIDDYRRDERNKQRTYWDQLEERVSQ